MILKFRGKEYGTGAYNFMWEYDMCGIIDSVLFEDKLEELKNKGKFLSPRRETRGHE